MAAFGAPGFPLGLGGPPAAVPGAAAAAPVGAPPVPAVGFTDAIMGGIAMGVDASGYELRYDVYTASLEPSLRFYDPPAAPPGARVPAAAAPAAAVVAPDPLGLEMARMTTYIRANRPRNWSNNNIANILREGRRAIAMPYDPANPAPYRAAFNGFLDGQANQLAAGVLPGNVVGHVNIGP